MPTYEQYQQDPSSEKCGLAVFEVARQLVGFSLYSGSIYYVGITEQVVTDVTVNGVSLTSVASLAALTSAGKYWFDRSIGRLYAWLSDSSDPAASVMVLVFNYHFSNVPVSAPWDLATGYDVPWLPMLDPESVFTYEIDGSNALLGVAVSNSSDLKLTNDRDFWDPIWDNVFFESHIVSVYSWNMDLAITEAKILYKGRVAKRTYAKDFIAFQLRDFLDELRSPVATLDLEDYVGARIPDSLLSAKQRTLYGYVKGTRPTNISQVLPSTGYPLTGTFTVFDGDTTIAGSGTAFLAELSPGDDIIVGTGTKVRVDAITSDTALTLSEAYDQSSQTGQTATVIPSHNKRYANRTHLVAGHALGRPSFTLTGVVDNSNFSVASTDGLTEGDTIEFSGQTGIIRVLGDTTVKLVSALGVSIGVGDVFYRSSVSKVYLDQDLLTLTDDYTYNAATAVITLTQTAEFNVALKRKLTGTIVVTSADRTVEGTNTQFNAELKTGDWISVASGSNWYEILEVVDDTNLLIRTSPGSSESGAALFKHPSVFGTRSVLSCDALGKKDSGGTFISSPANIAKDLLTDAGLSDYIDAASFTATALLLPYRAGLVIPAKFNDKKAPPLRDVLNTVCKSTFASIILNNDFELQMVPIDQSYSTTPTVFTERDFLDITVKSDNSQVVASAVVTYDVREYDAISAGRLDLIKTASNDQYLFTTEKQYNVTTCLVDGDDADIMASRWSFILSRSNSDIVFKTKMQGARIQVFDVIEIDHPKLYKRFGSIERTRLGVVLSVKKTIGGAEVLVTDLGNSFSRSARITSDTAVDFDLSSEAEKLINGYQTDANGLTNGLAGLNLIW